MTSLRTWLLAAATLSTGCGVAIDEYPCPPGGTELTYESFGKPFFSAYCNRCHSGLTGEREGAPGVYVFETLEQVRAHKARIFVRAATSNDTMPPGPDDPPLEDREELAEWLACGAP